MDRELVADPARLLEGEDLVQVVLGTKGPMRVLLDGGRLGEAAVVVGRELREEGHGGQAAQGTSRGLTPGE